MPPDEEEIVEAEVQKLDTEAALAEISADLFGQETKEVGEETEQQAETPAETSSTSAVETPPAITEEGGDQAVENSEAVQEVGAPKTWTADAIKEWATIPDRAKQEILKREEDMFRGLEQYRERAELGSKYDSVVEPYRAALAAEQIDPVGLFQAFAGNHYLLSRGTPEQKIELAASMLSHYGVPMEPLLTRMAGIPTVDPQVKALQDELNQIKSGLQSRDQSERDAQFAQVSATVDAFAADPKNVYYSEVAQDIAQLLTSGVAVSLQDAYDKAVFANPVTRQKEIDRLTAEKVSANEAAAKARADKVAKATGANVTSIAKSRDGTIAVGSIDDTLNETLERIRAQG